MKTTINSYYAKSSVHPYNTRSKKKMNQPAVSTLRPVSRRGVRPPMCSPLFVPLSHPIPRSDPQIEEAALTLLELSEPHPLPVIKEENSPKNTTK